MREALRQLQTGGLIEVLPNRGAVVRVPAPWEVREAYEVRAELEALAAARAVERISRGDVTRLREANQDMYDRSVERERGQGTRPSPAAARTTSSTTRSRRSPPTRASPARSRRSTRPSPATCLLSCWWATTVTAKRNFQEHVRIIDAIERGDAEAARREMREHVLKAGEQLARWYERRSATVFTG